jgi:hypothetical protein
LKCLRCLRSLSILNTCHEPRKRRWLRDWSGCSLWSSSTLNQCILNYWSMPRRFYSIKDFILPRWQHEQTTIPPDVRESESSNSD